MSLAAERALAAPFVLDPSARPTCVDISRYAWLEVRPVLRAVYDFQAYYGRCVIAEACLHEDALAEMRCDDLFDEGRQQELELSFDGRPTRENAIHQRTESVPPHGPVKVTVTGHLGQGSCATRINALDTTAPLPYKVGLVFGRWLLAHNEGALCELGNAMAAETKRRLLPELEAEFKDGVVPPGE